MTPPSLLFSRFLIACLMGGLLGILYDILGIFPRCLRQLWDGIFIVFLFICGIRLGFGVCEGDLRPAYSAGLFIGFLIWRHTLGRPFRRLISLLRRAIGSVFAKFWVLCKKMSKNISVFCKKTFAIVKK